MRGSQERRRLLGQGYRCRRWQLWLRHLIELGTLAAGSNFELKLDTTPVNFEIKQAEQTITGDDFSARIGSNVDLSEKFNASGSLSYEITGANTTGSSVSGSTLTVGGIGGGLFGPGRPCTRGQIVTFLYHVYRK